jgi:hypothetical protein
MEAAGYDRLSKLASVSGEVGTAGLGNCIAVVGFNGSKQMAIAHYNTLNCMGTSGNSSQWNEASLTNFRNWFVKQTQATKFMVGLGGVWFDNPSDSRFELIKLINKVFGYEPTVAASCITCTVKNGAGILTPHANGDVMPQGWGQMGLVIPYDQLRAR